MASARAESLMVKGEEVREVKEGAGLISQFDERENFLCIVAAAIYHVSDNLNMTR